VKKTIAIAAIALFYSFTIQSTYAGGGDDGQHPPPPPSSTTIAAAAAEAQAKQRTDVGVNTSVRTGSTDATGTGGKSTSDATANGGRGGAGGSSAVDNAGNGGGANMNTTVLSMEQVAGMPPIFTVGTLTFIKLATDPRCECGPRMRIKKHQEYVRTAVLAGLLSITDSIDSMQGEPDEKQPFETDPKKMFEEARFPLGSGEEVLWRYGSVYYGILGMQSRASGASSAANVIAEKAVGAGVSASSSNSFPYSAVVGFPCLFERLLTGGKVAPLGVPYPSVASVTPSPQPENPAFNPNQGPPGGPTYNQLLEKADDLDTKLKQKYPSK
jgi:hypothetical protein